MGFLSNVFKRNDQSSVGSISISKEELEDVIVCALLKVEEKRQATEALKAKEDHLTDSAKGILCTVLYTVVAILIIIFAASLFSFVFSKSDIFQSFRQISTLTRGFIMFVCIIYSFAIHKLCKGVKQETDRAYLISYFSAITSIASLFVALYSASR